MSTRSESLAAANRTAQLQKKTVYSSEYVTLSKFAEGDSSQVTDYKADAPTEHQALNRPAVPREVQIALAVLAIVNLVITSVILNSY